MTGRFVLPLLLILMAILHSSQTGSVCPPWEKIYPCFCVNFADGKTVHICSGIQNTSQLEQVTIPLKSMILDHLLLFDIFKDENIADATENLVDPKDNTPLVGMMPSKWLSELRVKQLLIQSGRLNNCFLCDEALDGQKDFLTAIVVKNTNIGGHLCSTCSLGSGPTSVSTRELRKTSLLTQVEFSHNNIEIIDGHAFPPNLRELKKIILSSNKIHRIYDNAFANLHQLTELDLSKNKLNTFNRRMFRNSDISLKILDLSFNSIQLLQEDAFIGFSGLREVKLSHNLLETLHQNTWTRAPTLLEKVELRGNFLVCNCTMHWIRRLNKSTKFTGHCIAPKEVEFQELKSIVPSIAAC